MSSVSSGPVRNWGCYRLHGEMRFEGADGPIDPEAIWSAKPECPGCEILESGLFLQPGYWRFRVMTGQTYGSSQISLIVKSLGLEDSELPLKSVDPEVDFFRTDLAGCLVIFEVKNQSQVLLAVRSLGKKKGGLVYPLDVYLERLV